MPPNAPVWALGVKIDRPDNASRGSHESATTKSHPQELGMVFEHRPRPTSKQTCQQEQKVNQYYVA